MSMERTWILDATGRIIRARMMRMVVASLAMIVMVMPASVLAADGADEPEHCDYFAETDTYLCFGFKAYWNDFGGIDMFGQPLTNEIQEDGMTVQYFEHARFEWHPSVWPERHDVLQGRVGSELTKERSGTAEFASADEVDGCLYLPATGHNVCDEFAERWEMSGGLPVFGYPISEAFEFDGRTVQYFERSRFEHHPGALPEFHDVLLGDVGAVASSLNDIRSVTEQYHDVAVAEADGYVPIEINGDLCVSDPDQGAMGIHYLNEALVGEEPIDVLQPQLLLYQETGDGLQLTGVEYFTPDVGQTHPILFDRHMDGPIDTIEGVPVHYQLHAWVWEDNPSGVFARFNPEVSCT